MHPDLPPSWVAAIARIEEGLARRVVVLGETDVGKSSFIRATMSGVANSGSPLSLIDLDPGQKMIGPPGTVALGSDTDVQRLVFVGSTSAGELSRIIPAASLLAHAAADDFIVNTAGLVRGPGVRLQSATLAAVRPDLIVVIGPQEPLTSILDAHPGIAIIRLERSPLATRKTVSERARRRQAGFAAVLAGAAEVTLARDTVCFMPAPPVMFPEDARPVCALAGADGEVDSLGILQEVGVESVVFAALADCAAAIVQLGKMWARPSRDGWQLLERLSPSWQQVQRPQ